MLTELLAVNRVLIKFFYLLLSTPALSQLETAHWYFGKKAGIDFMVCNGSSTTGLLTTEEGTSAISDKNGQLLFYTDGISVYNRQHWVMENGFGLKGHTSSMQSALIIPAVDDPSRYYIFTTDAQDGTGGFNYNVVNMNGDGGNGKVETKNVLLFAPSTEKVTATRHCNGKDIWVITHAHSSDAYYAYLVTAAGVSSTPVVSRGNYFGGVDAGFHGVMKVSPDGSRLVSLNGYQQIELSDFDNSTGVISNFMDLKSDQLPTGFGAEFSADSRLLYISSPSTDPSFIMQFDITLGTAAAIKSSGEIVAQSNIKHESWGAIQMAPNGYIYITSTDFYAGGMYWTGKYALHIIQLPSVKGKGCRFRHVAFELQNNPSGGLPNFMTTYFDKGFSAHNSCNSFTVDFKYKRPPNTVDIKWEFGDPQSGADNYSLIDQPQHTFSDPGNYTVSLIRTNKCGITDTISQKVQVYDFRLNVGNDTTLCEGASLVLRNEPDVNYYWQDELCPQRQYTVARPGQYVVEAINGNCVQQDTINIIYNSLSSITLGPDIKLCEGDKWEYNINVEPGLEYKWENGSTDLFRNIAVPGKYYLTVSGMCGHFTDTVNLIKGICNAWLPNAFTPNSDGRNDIYRVAGADNAREFSMEIFNRWGSRIFISHSNEKGWNGLINGREAAAGSYVCIVKFIHAETGESKMLREAFMLIR